MKINLSQLETFIKKLQENLKSGLDQETGQQWTVVPEWVKWDLRFKCYYSPQEKGIATEFYDIETATFSDIERLTEHGKSTILSFYEKRITVNEQH